MKKTLLLALSFFAFQSNAQIANGSQAPDFNVTDIYGNQHVLSEYLAAGKTVIMDISATWCGPCWNYHNRHILDDMVTAYGVEASNEVVVLFVEGDATTTIDDLYGTGTNTQGNWVEGTNYPIIDSRLIANLYQITAFPTVFRICPDGIVNQVSSSATAGSLRLGINSNCGPLTGVQNHVKALENEIGFCTSLGEPVAKIKNYGENVITSGTLNLKANNEVVATKAFTTTVNRFTTKTINFDAITFDPSLDYSVEVVNLNGGAIHNSNYATAPLEIYTASDVQTAEIVVKVYTDNYPSEISWKITNSSNMTVASGGPYAGTAAGGGIDANTTKIHNVTLPANGCYNVQVMDSYGDGWTYGPTRHGIEVFSNDVSVYNLPTVNFGTSLLKSNALTLLTLGQNEFQTKKFGIYPNPTTGVFQISTDQTVQVSIVDILGKIVYQADNVTSQTLIDMSGLEKGVYVAKITGDNVLSTEKVILK